MTQTVWIIDDDKAIRWVLEKSLARSGIAYTSFPTADDALNALYDSTPSVIISDIRMPGTDGLKFLAKVKQEHPDLPVIVMTAHSDLDSAVAAFQGGAFEYLPKPFDVDQAVALIERALAESRSSENDNEAAVDMPTLLGQAPAMQDVFRAIGRLSQSSVTVLITGESGSGKERVAEALHRHSVRAGKPFIALNTAAIPKDLLESELFGHEKGAFTGALGTRRGRFEEAEGGTLFLDEIGDMPTELQTRLLRVLSDGHFYRVGGHTPIKANVRVIAATHQNLEEHVKQGKFREDLFHRLNVIRLRLPALRERNEDIPLLTRHFLARSAANLGVEPKRLTEAAMELVRHYPFPGNVRQLENLCQWITVMAPGQTVEATDLPPEFRNEHEPAASEAVTSGSVAVATAAPPAGPAVAGDWTQLLAREVSQRLAAGETGIIDDLTARFESTCIRSGLVHTGGRKVEAAQLLGWGRNTLTRKIQELGLELGSE
ncbi:nitrogen regulation protein NR(I) [Vogesella oryzae]|uniref:nitrogen regulation protein NR(I) n=1 Tax=Vogesella oryzae TaxID=1735285 RepID=UPI001581F88F|nr:nitrogen regulation protein NR(I) [Vogesella oryzae]